MITEVGISFSNNKARVEFGLIAERGKLLWTYADMEIRFFCSPFPQFGEAKLLVSNLGSTQISTSSGIAGKLIPFIGLGWSATRGRSHPAFQVGGIIADPTGKYLSLSLNMANLKISKRAVITYIPIEILFDIENQVQQFQWNLAFGYNKGEFVVAHSVTGESLYKSPTYISIDTTINRNNRAFIQQASSVDIQRTSLLEAFSEFSYTANGLVIGKPGVGKSHTLRQFASTLIEKNMPVITLAVDNSGYAENTALFEQKFGGSFDQFILYLENRTLYEKQLGILIIDGFDAARSAAKREFFLNLVREVSTRLQGKWNVIISVREFDARRSSDLQALIPNIDKSAPEDRFCRTGISKRHFFIPELSSIELEAFIQSTNQLQEIFKVGSAEFRSLFNLPFNLVLLTDLQGMGISVQEISSIKSEIDLMDLYWEKRIGYREDIRQSLGNIVRQMLNGPELTISRDAAFNAAPLNVWEELLSTEILHFSDTEENFLSFPHNILFDYAVAKLAIGHQGRNFIDFLSEDPRRTLFLRPSLDYYLTRLWHKDNVKFWELYWAILDTSEVSHLRLIGKVLPPLIIVRETRRFEQLEPIISSIKNSKKNAVNSILNLLQALKATDTQRDFIWVEFIFEVSSHLTPEFAWILAQITSDIADRAIKDKSREIMDKCGIISRNLLKWVLQQRGTPSNPWFDNLGSIQGVPLVAKTFPTNSSSSRELLEKVLGIIEEDNFPIDYIWRLTDNIRYIWNYDPEFVAKIYSTVFKHEELSKESTPARGIIVQLVSNRHQDYDGCRYHLIWGFKHFLEDQLLWAARAAIESINYLVTRTPHHLPEFKLEAHKFPFQDNDAYIIPIDAPYRIEYGHTSSPQEMIDLVFHRLSNSGLSDEGTALVHVFRDHARVAYLWRRLIVNSLTNAAIYLPIFYELCVATPILEHCSDAIVRYINSIEPNLSDEQFLGIEQAVLRLPENRKKWILDDLPKSRLQTEESAILIAQIEEEKRNNDLKAQNAEIRNVLYQMFPPREEPDNALPENQKLASLIERMTELSRQILGNSVPLDLSEAGDVIKESLEALNIYNNADANLIQSIQIELVYLARLISHPRNELNQELLELCQQILLLGANHPDPSEESLELFDLTQMDELGYPREEAALGLPYLTERTSDPNIISAIQKLSTDKCATVRVRLIKNLPKLLGKLDELFWEIVIQRVETEEHPEIQLLLCRILGFTRGHNNYIPTLEKLASQICITGPDSVAMKGMGDLVALLIVTYDSEWARIQAEEFFANPVIYATALEGLVWHLLMVIRESSPDARISSLQAQKSVTYLEKSVDALKSGSEKLIGEVSDSGKWSDGLLNKAKTLNQILNEIVAHIYFACDIKDFNRGSDEKLKLDDSERLAFYKSIKSLLKKLAFFAVDEANFMFSADISHNLMQMFNGLLKYDPVDILHMSSKVTQASRFSGYQFDSMALDELVILVETILADFRHEVQSGQPLQDLLDILDIFVEAGWAEARSLVWRLDEVFRYS